MSLNTYLPGRLRNTPLPRSHGLLPLFEAVVNSIHSISEVSTDPAYGEITVEIVRANQSSFQIEDGKAKRGAPPQEPILGFKIIDNGSGFHEKNMMSFETLDSEYKAQQGCRGVGRLLWLKVFEAVSVNSCFNDADGAMKYRSFTFTTPQGIANKELTAAAAGAELKTCVHLSGFRKIYREKSSKTARTIANSLFEHCLWYFVRDGGAPRIRIKDDLELIKLEDVYDDYMFSHSKKENIAVKEQTFEITHLKLKASAAKQPFIAWCAARETLINSARILHG
ncbi:hypothetical protein [Azohydromonas australica]|uniref:hypothetical protein n=1 Tax=Azohydromonas australica TaxID=364039 RepID=UPI0012EB1904|nr:hypothetical protein [Azohydromonas australica]